MLAPMAALVVAEIEAVGLEELSRELPLTETKVWKPAAAVKVKD